MDQTLESEIIRLDRMLGEAEKQAGAVLGRVKGMRKKLGEGDMGHVAGTFEQVSEQLGGLSGQLQAVRDGMAYDLGVAMES